MNIKHNVHFFLIKKRLGNSDLKNILRKSLLLDNILYVYCMCIYYVICNFICIPDGFWFREFVAICNLQFNKIWAVFGSFLRYFWVFFLFMIGKITAENETILNLVY
jgi:hypothetical protein